MPLKHTVYDTDTHFSINPITRVLKSESNSKNTLIQHDHNSERVTFEIPRFVEGHDMSLCNVIQVHYNNIDAQTKAQSQGVYDVEDMQIAPDDENVVILSWLVSQNATRYVGSLNFLIRFSCTDDNGTMYYAWNTAVYSGISVSTGIYNGEVVAEEYADILEQWRQDLFTAKQNEMRVSVEGDTLVIMNAEEATDAALSQQLADGSFVVHSAKSAVDANTAKILNVPENYESYSYGTLIRGGLTAFVITFDDYTSYVIADICGSGYSPIFGYPSADGSNWHSYQLKFEESASSPGMYKIGVVTTSGSGIAYAVIRYKRLSVEYAVG